MFHNPEDCYIAALTMVDLFASVGVDRFDVTLTNLQGKKIRFRPDLTTSQVRRKIPGGIDLSNQQQENIIIRPRVSRKTAFLVQLDDVSEATLQQLEQAAFMAIETSPGNFQAWLAITKDNTHGNTFGEKETGSALRKQTGADTTASGATRLAGTQNFKEKYAPDYPHVAVTQSHPGRILTVSQLESMGLLVIPAIFVPKPKLRLRPPEGWEGQKPRRFPDYQRCLQNAPLNSKRDRQDMSRADYMWCIIAIDWGWSVDETAAQLLKERVDDQKKHRNGMDYAELTAKEAAKAVENNRARGW